MKKRINKIRAALLLSFLPLAAGLIMTIDSYYKILSVETAYNQVVFLRTLPHLLKKDRPLALPMYQENITLKKNPFITGTVSADYYMGRFSVYNTKIKVYRAPFISTSLYTLIDARIRNR